MFRTNLANAFTGLSPAHNTRPLNSRSVPSIFVISGVLAAGAVDKLFKLGYSSEVLISQRFAGERRQPFRRRAREG